jgi:hypothetical protein
VLGAPGAADVPHDAVVHAARAAGDLARVLTADGPSFALDVFTSGWEEVVGATSRPPRPTAACTGGLMRGQPRPDSQRSAGSAQAWHHDETTGCHDAGDASHLSRDR